MTVVGDVVDAVGRRTRPEKAAAWDPVGLQLGDREAPVSRVAVCHEVTEDVVGALEASPVDLLVAYHPLLFAPVNRVLAGRSAEARAYRLIRLGVNLLVAHTDFDAAPGGAADALAASLGLSDVEPFGGDPDEGFADIGRVGGFAAPLADLEAQVSGLFGGAGLRVSGDRAARIDSVAVVPGSGASLIEAAAGVAQALVTGDAPHHRMVRARDLGLAVVDPGHTQTERPGIAALLRLVTECCDVEVVDLTGLDPSAWG